MKRYDTELKPNQKPIDRIREVLEDVLIDTNQEIKEFQERMPEPPSQFNKYWYMQGQLELGYMMLGYVKALKDRYYKI